MVEEEEETQAQNKVVFGLLFLVVIYLAFFAVLWALFGYTLVAGVTAFSTVWLFAIYHVKMIDGEFDFSGMTSSFLSPLYGVQIIIISEKIWYAEATFFTDFCF